MLLVVLGARHFKYLLVISRSSFLSQAKSGADPEKLQGEGMNRSGALPIPKIQNLNGFWPLYFGGAYFQFFKFFKNNVSD